MTCPRPPQKRRGGEKRRMVVRARLEVYLGTWAETGRSRRDRDADDWRSEELPDTCADTGLERRPWLVREWGAEYAPGVRDCDVRPPGPACRRVKETGEQARPFSY